MEIELTPETVEILRRAAMPGETLEQTLSRLLSEFQLRKGVITHTKVFA